MASLDSSSGSRPLFVIVLVGAVSITMGCEPRGPEESSGRFSKVRVAMGDVPCRRAIAQCFCI